MDQLFSRRTLAKTVGAAIGIASAARLRPAGAQDATPAADAAAGTGIITGVVTDVDTGEPLADVYIVVGWEDAQLAGITDAEGRYRVPNVPVGETVDVLGFHEGGYRYHNSDFDANTVFDLEPGQTVTYDFGLVRLNQPEGEPQLSDPVIDPQQAMPGEAVTFEVTAKGGQGGLSPEIIAANPGLGRMVLMESVGDDRFRTTFTIPSDASAGDYPFAFFAASNECFVNSEFPMVTLSIGGGAATPAATPAAASPVADGQQGQAQSAVTVEMVDVDFNPNEFAIPADTDVTVTLPNNGAAVHNFNIDGKNNPSDPGIHSGDVPPGNETTVTVNLPPGDWYYYCSIPGHEAAGMFGTVHVE